jgi:uncharacterized protein YgiB involved in biofilm formation
MTFENRRTTAFLLCLLILPAALAGCGDSEAVPQAPIVRGVFTTAADCSNLGTLTLAQCSDAISSAVSAHDGNAPVYSSLKACEKEEGAEKCERTSERSYRPRLMAFLVAMSTPPQSSPLYPTKKGELGFRTADNTLLASDDENLTFSLQARSAAETFAGKAGGGGGGLFGD